MKDQFKRIFFVAIVILIIFAFGLIAGEGYLRWHHFGLPTSEKHLPHPYLQTLLRFDVEFHKGEKLDPDGFRRTGPFHQGKETYKILTIGDSCTFSISSSSQKKSYPAQLERLLIEKNGSPFEVYNAGVPGYNSLQMFLWLTTKLKTIHPDEIIVYGGWNDFRILMHDRGMLYIENNCLGMPDMYRHGTYWELSKKQSGFLHRLLSKSYLVGHLAFKVKAYWLKKKVTRFWHEHPLSELPPEPLFIEEVFTNFRNNMENIISLSKGKGMKVSVITLASPLRNAYTEKQEAFIRKKFGHDFLRMTPSEMARYVFKCNDILRDLAEKYDCGLFDWARWYQEVDDAAMFVDIVHPSDKGYSYLAEKIVSHLNLSEKNSIPYAH
jgi:lysophospholipase L1-like esterase